MNSQDQPCTAQDNKIFCFEVLADILEGNIYSDLTRNFKALSFAGHQCILCAMIIQKYNSVPIYVQQNRQ